MATSVPEDPRWSPDAAPAERILWRWAVEQLDDRILALPQVSLTLPGKGKPDEAEIDLVLIDPEAGVTAVEVKGGSVSFSGGRWFQNGRESSRDPVDQVKRARSILRTVLQRANVDTATLALRWAVAVPEGRLASPGEPIMGDHQLWDALASEQLTTMYDRVVGALTQGEQPLGDDRAQWIATYLRGRARQGRPSLLGAVQLHEETIRVHTESHRNVLAQFTSHPHVLVRGAAGTGKTVLALEAAARQAAWGGRVLLVCWNVVLGQWMRTALRARLEALGSPAAAQVTHDPTGQVVVSDVGGLAEAVVGDLPDLPPTELYHEWLPDRFLDLSPGATAGEFDLVVMDEAQDLSEAWVLAVASLVARDGRWFAFSDRQQDLFHANAALPDFLEVHHELRENFRNSPQIAAFAARFGDVEMDCLADDGPPVEFVAVPADRVVAEADAVTRRLQRTERFAARDLAVLYLFHNPHRYHSDDVARAALGDELVVTNGASFKGMERAVIVLGLDMDPAKSDRVDDVRRSLYAAATRARSHLIVVGDPEVVRAYGFTDLADDLAESGDMA